MLLCTLLTTHIYSMGPLDQIHTIEKNEAFIHDGAIIYPGISISCPSFKGSGLLAARRVYLRAPGI